MKVKILSTYTRILTFFLVLLGFSSCQTTKCEYGSPSAMLNIDGKVIDEKTKEAIKAIEVTIQEVGGNGHFQEIKSLTNGQGGFCVHVDVRFASAKTIKVSFKDIDGEANGEFTDQEVTVTIAEEDFKGASGNWYRGEANKDLGSVELAPKVEEE